MIRVIFWDVKHVCTTNIDRAMTVLVIFMIYQSFVEPSPGPQNVRYGCSLFLVCTVFMCLSVCNFFSNQYIWEHAGVCGCVWMRVGAHLCIEPSAPPAKGHRVVLNTRGKIWLWLLYQAIRYFFCSRKMRRMGKRKKKSSRRRRKSSKDILTVQSSWIK